MALPSVQKGEAGTEFLRGCLGVSVTDRVNLKSQNAT